MNMIQHIGDVPTRFRALFPKWRGHIPLRQRLTAVSEALFANHAGLAGAIDAAPYAAFEAAHRDLPPVHCYRVVPNAARAMLASVPDRLRAPWLCGLLIDRIAIFEKTLAQTRLAAEFAYHYRDSFHRILDQIDRNPGVGDIGSDAFMKDLWLTRGVMIPAYASILWPRSGLSIRAVLRGGLPAIYKVMRHCGGWRPMLEGHTHDSMARAYWNEAGWRETMRLCALTMLAMPAVRGSFGVTWYYDPAVLDITPKLGFTHRLQLDHGAFRFCIGSSEAAIGHALAANAARRNRYREGKYLPTDYAIVWSRRALIAAYGPDATPV